MATDQQVTELMDWLTDPANDEFFARVEHNRALERGRVTSSMIERGARRLWELDGCCEEHWRRDRSMWRWRAECVLRAAFEESRASPREQQNG